jgi:hypothetical protein
VRDGYVTVEAAERDYGVVIDVARDLVDEEATAVLRAGPRPPEPDPVGAGIPGPRPLVTPDL